MFRRVHPGSSKPEARTRAAKTQVLTLTGLEPLLPLTQTTGLTATCIVWCDAEFPDKRRLAELDLAAQTLRASGWVIADLAEESAAGWLDRLPHRLARNLPFDEVAGRAGSRLIRS